MNREESFEVLNDFISKRISPFCYSFILGGLGIRLFASTYEADIFHIFSSYREQTRFFALGALSVLTPFLLREGILTKKAFSLKRQLEADKESYIGGSDIAFNRNMGLINMRKVKVYGKKPEHI